MIVILVLATAALAAVLGALVVLALRRNARSAAALSAFGLALCLTSIVIGIGYGITRLERDPYDVVPTCEGRGLQGRLLDRCIESEDGKHARSLMLPWSAAGLALAITGRAIVWRNRIR